MRENKYSTLPNSRKFDTVGGQTNSCSSCNLICRLSTVGTKTIAVVYHGNVCTWKKMIIYLSVTAVCVYIGELRPNYGNWSVDHLARVRAFRYAHLSLVIHYFSIRPLVYPLIPLLLLGFRLRWETNFSLFARLKTDVPSLWSIRPSKAQLTDFNMHTYTRIDTNQE